MTHSLWWIDYEDHFELTKIFLSRDKRDFSDLKNEISKRKSIIRAYSIERAWSKSDVLIWNKFIPDSRRIGHLGSSSVTSNDPEE